MLSYEDIVAARGRIGDGIVETGCPRSQGLDRSRLGRVHFKTEFRQRTGSFKDRGSLNRLLREAGIFNVGDPRAPMNGYPQVNSYLSWMNRFAGGGREIELNIIAQRGLGLPR